MLTIESLRELLREYVRRGYSWNKARNAIMIEYVDISILVENEEEIRKQYESHASFNEARRNRYNTVAA